MLSSLRDEFYYDENVRISSTRCTDTGFRNYVEKVLNSRISHGLISWNMGKIACVIRN